MISTKAKIVSHIIQFRFHSIWHEIDILDIDHIAVGKSLFYLFYFTVLFYDTIPYFPSPGCTPWTGVYPMEIMQIPRFIKNPGEYFPTIITPARFLGTSGCIVTGAGLVGTLLTWGVPRPPYSLPRPSGCTLGNILTPNEGVRKGVKCELELRLVFRIVNQQCEPHT